MMYLGDGTKWRFAELLFCGCVFREEKDEPSDDDTQSLKILST